MSDMQGITDVQTVAPETLYEQLVKVDVLTHLKRADVGCLGKVELVKAPGGSTLYRAGEGILSFWLLLNGAVRATKAESDGTTTFLMDLGDGGSFGEVPLITGHSISHVNVHVVKDSVLVRVGEQGFWSLLATCPRVREAILGRVMQRLQLYQALTARREKLISLGTLAAGLMHELNNPGSAARRAASQLRENMTRLQQISLRFSKASLSEEQLDCMRALQKEALSFQQTAVRSSLEQADAEDALASWLESMGVENAWKLAPTLTLVGWTQNDIVCAQHVFPQEILSDALNWLDALISSVHLVGTIEESITRVTELVSAVKRYSYDDKGTEHQVDVQDGMQSTITILGHKLRQKSLNMEKHFSSGLPKITTCGTGLNQVWTNLLDNAMDAAPEGSTIRVRTWSDGDSVCVGIADSGSGIAPEHQAHIFEPFFTTKPVGVGTGLGLDIAHRIVVGNYGGEITFTTGEQGTEFVVRLPLKTAATK